MPDRWRYVGDGVMVMTTRTHMLEVYPSGALAPDGQPFFRWITTRTEGNHCNAHGLTVGEEAAMKAAMAAAKQRRGR